MEKILEIKNLNKYYEKGLINKKSTIVLDNINLSVNKGEILGLVGESGCGKTTLSRCITGLINDYEGKIIYNGKALEKKSSKERTENIQMVFQDNSSALNPRRKINWILQEHFKVRKINDTDYIENKIKVTLDLVALPIDVLNRYPSQLSGGQLQRIGIASALMLDPKVIIADEPVSSLDVSIQAQILNLLQTLNKKLKLSIIFISHDLNVVYYLCDRIAIMNDGKIVECDEANKIFYKPENLYTKKLIDSILI